MRSTLPGLGKLRRSQAEVNRALAIPGEVTTRVWAGARRWRRHAEEPRLSNSALAVRGNSSFPFPSLLHGSFVFRSPTEEASSKRQGWGQSPPAQRQLPMGCVTAVTLFHLNKCQQRMTWGWCSPALGLIGPSSGLNAKVSWQREAEEPDFPIPAPLRERGGCWEKAGTTEQGAACGSPALPPGTQCAVPARSPARTLELG